MRAPAETAPPSGPEGAMAHVDGAGALWMVSLTFLWGLNAVAIKVLTLGMAPIMSAALRGVIALVLLTGYAWLKGESFRYERPVLFHAALSACAFAMEGVLLYHGARFTNGGHISIFINMAPFFVATGGHYLLPGERLHTLKVAGLALAFAGVVLLFSDQLYVQQQGFWRGDLLVMGAAAMWATSTLYIKGVLAHRLSALRLMWIRILVSTLLLLAASLLSEPEPFFAVTRLTLLTLFFQGSVVVFFSYMMWVRLLQRYPAGDLQAFSFLTPVWGVLTGVALLGETVSVPMAGGIVLVGAGLYLVNQRRRAPAMPQSPAGRDPKRSAP
jgi:drug/metabolite transporter (DMT)-like permease